MIAVFEVRYDDDEAYHVVARFTDKAAAERLRDRIIEANRAADTDDCHVESSWTVETVAVDDFDPEGPLPDLFEADPYAEGHAQVRIEAFPLAALASDDRTR